MRNKKKGRSRWPVVMILLILGILLGCYIVGSLPEARGVGAALLTDNALGVRADEPQEWNLILVNAKNHVPKDHQVELTTLSNGEQVDSRIYPDLQAMFDAARADGLQLFVADGYRTSQQQQEILDEKIEDYRDEGYPRRMAVKLAKEWVAVPGASEHELGIAVDINAETEVSSSDEVYAWLEENGHKYGFINRYPADKTDITGVISEPWHYRYVGYDAASYIHSQGLCLEEYLQELDQST